MSQIRLVKLLDKEDFRLDTLNCEHIQEYVEAKKCLGVLQSFIIDPFATHVKENNLGLYVPSTGISLEVVPRVKNIKHSVKQVVEKLESLVHSNIEHNADERIIHGVKKFNGKTHIDSHYLGSKLSEWKNQILGTREEIKINYTAPKETIDIHKSRLVTIPSNLTFSQELTENDILLYAVADKTAEAIKKKIIKPLEVAFKKDVEKIANHTSYERKTFGDSIVQVKTVPRFEPKYVNVLSGMSSYINKCMNGEQSIQDDITKNLDLKHPRNYISAESMLKTLNGLKEDKMELKFRQELSILKDFRDVTYLL